MAEKKKICMIAHRGYSSQYPGNTEIAFLEAAKHASGGAETDIRITKDGVYVLSHNKEVTFFDGTERLVSDSTYAELTEKPLLNTQTQDVVYLCTLERYLEIMRDNNMICFVEMKGEFTDDQIKGAFALVDKVYALKQCIFQSFVFENLLKARSFYPDLPLMLTYGRHEASIGYQQCLDNNVSIDSDYTFVTDTMLKDFHTRNLYVACWTVNTDESLSAMKKFPLDFIESDVFGGNDI